MEICYSIHKPFNAEEFDEIQKIQRAERCFSLRSCLDYKLKYWFGTYRVLVLWLHHEVFCYTEMRAVVANLHY